MSSYILKCTVGDKHFICNRNHTWFENLAPQYMEWWEVCEVELLGQCDNVEVLEEIEELDNYNRKDQKELNKIKKQWMKDDPDLSENEKICDVILMKGLQQYKKHLRERQQELKDNLRSYNLSTDMQSLYRWYFFKNRNWKQLLSLPRYKWEDLKVENLKMYTYCLVEKDFLDYTVCRLMRYRERFQKECADGQKMTCIAVEEKICKYTHRKRVWVPDDWVVKDDDDVLTRKHKQEELDKYLFYERYLMAL